MAQARRMVLLAGPSGSGKSRLAAVAGCPRLNLDDFYHDGDQPGLPRTLGTVDWDHPGSWDLQAALDAAVSLCRTGRAVVPVYDISRSRRTGQHEVALGAARVFVAEGVFAPELLGPARATGIAVTACYLDRSRTGNLVRRFLRDVAEHRKPLPLLLRRGRALWHQEPQTRAAALAAGFDPVPPAQVLTALRAGSTPDEKPDGNAQEFK